MNRRTFISQGVATAILSGIALPAGAGAVLNSFFVRNPSWYGFNLLELFSGYNPKPFQEKDFEMMAEWKFNFARIPMSYWNWSKPDISEWTKIDESVFKIVDHVVEYGKRYNIHVCMNLHRIPGYCVNDREKEPVQLFSGPIEDQQKALNAATFHWQYIARRYKDIDNSHLSFDLINEPASDIPKEKYIAVIKHLMEAIHKIDRHRRIVIDGFDYGNIPISQLASDKNIFQSTHGYAPMQLTHYKATWVGDNSSWPVPAWPLKISESDIWDKDRLRKHFRSWKEINHQGVKVHVGEWGVYNHTPHAVTLAYMKDQMDLWKEYGWGWSLWNLRGDFGVLDSNRKDVSYESYKGHRLDRKMLEVLMAGSG